MSKYLVNSFLFRTFALLAQSNNLALSNMKHTLEFFRIVKLNFVSVMTLVAEWGFMCGRRGDTSCRSRWVCGRSYAADATPVRWTVCVQEEKVQMPTMLSPEGPGDMPSF